MSAPSVLTVHVETSELFDRLVAKVEAPKVEMSVSAAPDDSDDVDRLRHDL